MYQYVSKAHTNSICRCTQRSAYTNSACILHADDVALMLYNHVDPLILWGV